MTPSNEVAKLLASDGAATDNFGYSVAVAGDTAVIGARDDDNGNLSGSAYVFVRDSTGAWAQQAKLLPSDGAAGDYFGDSVALAGDTAVIGAYGDDDHGINSGSAYVFVRDGTGAWMQQAKLLASDGSTDDNFGRYSVAVAGDTAVIGAYGNDDYGTDSGSAYVFVRDGTGAWTQQAKLLASDGAAYDFFGRSVALAGDTAVIGAYGDNDNGSLSGSAYVFVRDGTGAWTQQAKLIASDGADYDHFGDSVALAGDTAVIGAYGDDDFSGSAYVFVRDGTGAWTEQAKLIASDRELYESSCGSVGVSGTTVVTGAPYHDVEGAMNAGAAYVFSSVDAEGPPPSVTGIWTSAAPLVGQTISLFVFGNYFDTAPSGTQVSINEIPQLLVQVVTPEMLIVRVNPVTSGMIGGPVEVCTTSGCAMSEPPYFGDTLAGVNITGIWPASASVGEFVFVFGSGYEFPISVVIGATPVPLVQVVSPDMFIMLVPAGASTGPLWVMTPSGAATSAEDLIIVP